MVNSQSLYNACLDDMNVFHHDWHIREWFEHNTGFTFSVCDFAHRNTNEGKNCTQVNWATWEHTEHTHLAYLPAPSAHQACYELRPSTPGVRTFHYPQMALLRHVAIACRLQSFRHPPLQANRRASQGNTLICTAVFIHILAINVRKIVPPFLLGSSQFF